MTSKVGTPINAENGGVITKKDLVRMFWRSLPMEFSWHYERQMHMGFEFMVGPALKKIYKDDPEGLKEALHRNLEFFNCTAHVTPFIGGITLAMEEMNRANDDFDASSINAVKAALMGPLSGIGDSLIVGTLIPVLLGIALGLSNGGSPVGAIFYIVVWNLLAYFGMKFAYYKGYELGGKAVEFLVGPTGVALRKAIGTVGGMVIGAVAATWVSVKTSFELKNAAGKPFLQLQKQLDAVYPGMLTAAFIILCWWLMAKKKMSPIKVMLLLVVIAFVGVFIGFFNPNLKY